MDADERLRLDYDQTTELVRTLLDVRFKLLTLVPTIAGAAVALVGSGRPPAAELLAVGLLIKAADRFVSTPQMWFGNLRRS